MRYGIDIGGTKIAGAALAPDGREAAAARLPNPKGDYEGAVANVAAVVRALVAKTGVAPTRLGVCVSGNVRPATGSIRLGTAWWLRDRPFRDDIAAATGLPVRLANDADCFALSEATDGAGQGARSVFGVILGTGVGGGFVLDGRLVAGRLGVAGEIGHMPMPGADEAERAAGPCSCGKFGCAETLLSGGALSADYARAAGIARDAAPDARALAEMAADGDAEAEAALARYESRLARLCGVLVNVVEPDVIVLGGGVSNVARLYDAVAPQLPAHVFGGACETRILRNVHGDSSGVRGAARLWEGETG
ncbi:MAG: ROK family protein [Rhodobacteraceae bacterium]|nr:MAG: ROK family protein [Paracoccaceae bacterium]